MDNAKASLTVRKGERGRVPIAAAWLGGLGLIPFLLGSIMTVATDSDWGIDALRFYGAAILSFMGGIHWGLAIADDGGHDATLQRLGTSVIPPLIGWSALLLDPTQGLILLALAFAVLLLGDIVAVRLRLAPRWYPRLRLPLTAVVVPCLLVGAAGA